MEMLKQNGGERESLRILKDVQAWELPIYWHTCTSCFTVGDVAIAGDVCLLSLCLTLSPPFSLQCSVSCGVGTQRRQQMCQKLTAKGRRVPLSETLCRHLSGPPLVRSCQMPVCGSKYGKSTLRGICSFYSPPPVVSFSIEQLISNL